MLSELTTYKKIVLKEVFFQIIEKVIRIFIGIIIIKQLADYLGPSLFGIYNFIESYYLIIFGLSVFGLDITLTKLLSRKKRIDLVFGNGMILMLFFGIVFMLLSFIIINLFFNNDKYTLLIVVSTILIINPVYVLDYYFISRNQIRISSIFKIVAYVFKSFLIIYSITKELSLLYFILIILFEVILYSIMVSFYFFFNPVKIKYRIDKNFIKNVLSSSSYVFLYSIGAIIYNRIDVLMIERFLTNQDLGFYSASFKLISFFYFIPAILSQTFFPKIVELAKLKLNNSNSLSLMYKLNFFSALIVFFGLLFFGEIIINFMFGEAFSNSVLILYILSFNIVLISIGSIYSKVLYSNNLEKRLFIKVIFGILINIFLNIILIEFYGVYGVAISTAVALFLIEVVYDFFDKRLIKFHVFKLKSIFLINK
tara:strand:- start:10842 stop:12116 length:1275 start_codon:yes stop_codon:yes gene_type:complete